MMYDDDDDEDWFNSDNFLYKEQIRCLTKCIHERSVVIKHLIDVLEGEETKIFWPVFLDVWPCGPTWTHRNHILQLLRHHAAQEPARNYMDTLAGSFFDGLPSIVKVFRGCNDHCVRGLTWTVNKSIAMQYARLVASNNQSPVLATSKIPKEAIFAVSFELSEIILDPRHLGKILICSV